MIVNQGEGDFLLRAAGPTRWPTTGRSPSASSTKAATRKRPSATLVYGGDGHDHWHVKEVESHVIEDLDGNVLGSVVKSGFCFFDTDAVRPDLRSARDEGVCIRGLRRPVRQRQPDGAVRRLG